MKFDTIIIGGGLSGLTCAIALAEEGKKCAVVSSGQSSLHFLSGSFDLLGFVDKEEIQSPIDKISLLSENHPYSLVGKENVKSISAGVPAFFNRMGVKVYGKNTENHYRLTPTGNLRPTWLTFDEYLIPSEYDLKGKKVLVLNIAGYLDLPVKFVLSGLEKQGAECMMAEISLPELERRRESASEMRSVNISKVLDTIGLETVADEINNKGKEFDLVLLPAVFGWNDISQLEDLRRLLKVEVKLLATLPPSVPGVRLQTIMRKYFQSLGGTILLGDTVTGGKIENGKLKWVNTCNLEDEKLIADSFVLATGSFFSHGLAGAPNEIYEPIFGLNVNAKSSRSEWYDERFFNEQPYMRFGVAVNNEFQASKGNETIENLYVAGSVLSGANQIKEASMGGISLITGLYVAKLINKK